MDIKRTSKYFSFNSEGTR